MGGVDHDVDVSGMVCPQPAAIVRRCLTAMDPGDALVVTGDYPPAERSIRRTCYRHGFEVEAVPVGAGADADDDRQADDDARGEESDPDAFALRIVVTDAAAASMRARSDAAPEDGAE